MDTFSLLVFLSIGAVVSSQTCDEAHYKRCLHQLHKFTKKNDLIFASNHYELQNECLQAQTALGCLTRYARKCLPLEERDTFMADIAGPQKVVMGLCTEENDLRRRYLEILPCLRNASDGLLYCKEKYDRNQRDIVVVEYEDKVHLSCCSFDGYRRCLRMLMELHSECAEGIADVTEDIVLRIGGGFPPETCEEHFDRCTGSDSWRTLSNVFLLSLCLVLSQLVLR